jgi:alpha-1,2-glucosyltransferase
MFSGPVFCLLQHALAAVSGLLSLFFRQTNVIWVAYVVGTSITLDLKARRVGRAKMDSRLPDTSAPPSLGLLLDFIKYMLYSWRRLLSSLWPYALPLLGFMAFLAWNGGSIVLGDKAHHRPVFHAAQLAYYAIVAALLHEPLLPVSRRAWAGLLHALQGLGVWSFVLLAGAAWLLDRFTLSHPFLLADNRHYTFYLWRRVLGRTPHLNVVLLPLYGLCWWWTLSRVRQASCTVTAGILVVAVSLVLLPAHLLEPRYLTVPVVVSIVEAAPRSQRSVLITLAGFVLINVLTIYIFLYRPFAWNDGSIARFMW